MDLTTITATDFKRRTGQYLDESAKAPIYITRHDRPVRVLIDAEEYERLKAFDTRQALYAHELDDSLLDNADLGERNPELDYLMD